MIPMIWSLTWNGLMAASATRTITAATATFTVPRARGPVGEVAYWLGVGGAGQDRRDLCQAGISVGGGNHDGLIAEDWPTPPQGGVPVQPGDTIVVRLQPVAHWYRITAVDVSSQISLSIGCRVPYGGRGWRTVEFIGEDGARPLLTTPVTVRWTATGLARPYWTHWLVAIAGYEAALGHGDTLRLVS